MLVYFTRVSCISSVFDINCTMAYLEGSSDHTTDEMQI